eukprot:1629694-Amphidinium_carterae.1
MYQRALASSGTSHQQSQQSRLTTVPHTEHLLSSNGCTRAIAPGMTGTRDAAHHTVAGYDHTSISQRILPWVRHNLNTLQYHPQPCSIYNYASELQQYGFTKLCRDGGLAQIGCNLK